MRAAIYARRSTEEHQADSLTVQVEEARRFIKEQGWSLDDEHVFLEDGISRAEFKNRPALFQMLDHLERKEFDIIVTRDETRLGGDALRTGLLMQKITDSGARIFYYFTAKEVCWDDATSRFTANIMNLVAELEREKITQRVRENLKFKAQRGFNTGGRVYGYDNERTTDHGAPRTEYRINAAQAAVVQEIFTLFADGSGLVAIAKALNDRREPSPRAGRRGTGSWDPSTIRSILQRERYTGVVPWGAVKKRYRDGTKVREKAPPKEHILVQRPELRIVPEDLWERVQAQMAANRAAYGGTSKPGQKAKYLLSGLGKCGQCEGPIAVCWGTHGKERIQYYGCSYNRKRGQTVCTNSLRRPISGIDHAVTKWIQDEVLREGIMLEILRELRARLAARASNAGQNIAKLESERRKLRKEIDRLAEAIAELGHSSALATKVAQREARLAQLDGEIAAVRAAPGAIDAEAHQLEAEVRSRVAELRELLGRCPAEARTVMEALFDGKVVFTPIRDERGARYRIQGKIRTGALFDAQDTDAPSRTSPQGRSGISSCSSS